MSESRVRENRMHGLTGGGWRNGTGLAEKGDKAQPCARRQETTDQPAAYLTA